MHSRNQLFGSVCKCMGCAKARNERILREARERFRDDWLAMIDAEDRAEELAQEAQAATARAATIQRVLRETTLQKLKEEHDAE